MFKIGRHRTSAWMMLETFRRLRTFCIFDLIQIIFNYNGLNRIGIYVMICPKENLVKSKYSYENFKFKKKSSNHLMCLLKFCWPWRIISQNLHFRLGMPECLAAAMAELVIVIWPPEVVITWCCCCCRSPCSEVLKRSSVMLSCWPNARAASAAAASRDSEMVSTESLTEFPSPSWSLASSPVMVSEEY